MKRELAQKLLSAILDWSPEEVEDNRELLEDFSELKYDLYQQYRPGSRFVENLSIWLYQFKDDTGKVNVHEGRLALDFLLKHLIFISPDELHHLISIVYPDTIVPMLKNKARELAIKEKDSYDNNLSRKMFSLLQRQSLFLGLSDGARTDIFRRSNPILSNEQVCVNYDISNTKISDIINEMKKDTKKILEGLSLKYYDINSIQNIFLLDDFSGSGISYMRYESDKWKGKISNVLNSLINQKIDVTNVTINIILYLATPKAIEKLKSSIDEYSRISKIVVNIYVVQHINPIEPNAEEIKLLKKYYSKKDTEDSHYLKGKHHSPHLGFDECSLPLVLYHNTPNNSFPILWSGENSIFPRVIRHKDVN